MALDTLSALINIGLFTLISPIAVPHLGYIKCKKALQDRRDRKESQRWEGSHLLESLRAAFTCDLTTCPEAWDCSESTLVQINKQWMRKLDLSLEDGKFRGPHTLEIADFIRLSVRYVRLARVHMARFETFLGEWEKKSPFSVEDFWSFERETEPAAVWNYFLLAYSFILFVHAKVVKSPDNCKAFWDLYVDHCLNTVHKMIEIDYRSLTLRYQYTTRAVDGFPNKSDATNVLQGIKERLHGRGTKRSRTQAVFSSRDGSQSLADVKKLIDVCCKRKERLDKEVRQLLELIKLYHDGNTSFKGVAHV